MISVSGYRVGERIHHTPHSEVYAATRLTDGLKVVVKVYSFSQSDLLLSRAQREFELLCRVDAPGVVRAVEVAQSAQSRSRSPESGRCSWSNAFLASRSPVMWRRTRS
jgi:hypothetical protein